MRHIIQKVWLQFYHTIFLKLKNLNRIEEALHNYTKAIEIKPDWHPPYINKRILLQKYERKVEKNQICVLSKLLQVNLESQGMFSQALKCNEEAEQNVQKQYHNSELPQKGNILFLMLKIKQYQNKIGFKKQQNAMKMHYK